MVSDEKAEVKEKSHAKQVLTMNSYLDWLINSIPTIHPSLESTTSVSGEDTCNDVRETEMDTTNKKPTSKKSPEVLPYIRVSEQMRRVPAYFKAYEHIT